MIITEIAKQRGHLYEIFLDNGESALLDTQTVAESGLYKGAEISEERLHILCEKSDYTRAFSRAVWYIERGDISRKALCDKLKKAGFTLKAINESVDRLCELNLINDTVLAERTAEMLLENNISARQAFLKMVNRGIPRDIAKAALENIEHSPESQIRAVINKKYKNKLSDPANTQKVFAALMRLGFGYSDVRNVLKAYCEEIEYSEDSYGL